MYLFSALRIGVTFISKEGHIIDVLQKNMLASCTVCDGKKTVTDESTGEVICNKCGTVLVENVEVSEQPRAFSKEEFESRNQTGAPTSLARHDMGLSTVISRFDKDASGRKLNADMQMIMDRIRVWDNRTQLNTSRDRNLMFASSELSRLKYKLGLTDAVIEKAAYLYRKAQERKLVRGRTKVALVSASIYAACRELSIQRTLKDLSAASGVKLKDLSRCYRLILRELELNPPLLDPTKMVAKVANAANLSEKTTRDATKALALIRDSKGTAGKDPMGLAAAVLYLASLKNNERIGQRELAQAAGVTEVTLRNRAKEIVTTFNSLF
jgi:transcription initiation factor TFIIB